MTDDKPQVPNSQLAVCILICLLSTTGQVSAVLAQELAPTLPPRPTIQPTLPPRPTVGPTLPPRPTIGPTLPPRPTVTPTCVPRPTLPPTEPPPPEPPPLPAPSEPALPTEAPPTPQPTIVILPISGNQRPPDAPCCCAADGILLVMGLGILAIAASLVPRRRT